MSWYMVGMNETERGLCLLALRGSLLRLWARRRDADVEQGDTAALDKTITDAERLIRKLEEL